MRIAEKLQPKDALGARTSGTAAENANLNSGKVTSLCAISFSKIRPKTRSEMKSIRRIRKRGQMKIIK